MNVIILLAVVVVMFGMRFLKPGALAWGAIWWVGVFVAFRYGVDPPMPVSILNMFMFIVSLVLVAYVSAANDRMREATDSLIAFFVDPRYKIALTVTLLAVPALVAFQVYSGMSSQPQPPIASRTIHPPPPDNISFKGKQIDLLTVHNPFRELEESEPARFAAHVASGRRVYYENCLYCHGDNMEGDGLFAHGFNPIPANFQDPTTIAMLQESYLFWRIAKGAPGLPSEATPWLSAMPAWESFLSEDEIWEVILFLYDYTEQRPRASEEVH